MNFCTLARPRVCGIVQITDDTGVFFRRVFQRSTLLLGLSSAQDGMAGLIYYFWINKSVVYQDIKSILHIFAKRSTLFI